MTEKHGFMVNSHNISSRIQKLSPQQKELLLQKLQVLAESDQGPSLQARKVHSHLPVSFAQERLWLLDQLQREDPIYTVALAAHIQGYINREALESSLAEIVHRHEVLRTRFALQDGQPIQIIASDQLVPLALKDLRLQYETADEQATAIHHLLREEIQRPFNLSEGPLLRAMLLCLDTHQHILLLTLHYIVCDGWSRSILFRELATHYESFSTGQPGSLPALPIQYADFALWQKQFLQGAKLETELRYWKQQLAHMPEYLQLPLAASRPALQTYKSKRQEIILAPTLAANLKRLCQQEECTLFMLLLASFQILLWRYTEQTDIAIGTPVANRQHAALEQLIGCFVNTIVLRADLSGAPGFRELLRRVREVCLQAFAHQDLPFEQLVDALRVPRNLSYTPLFQVMFILQNVPPAIMKLPGIELQPLDIDTGATQFDLTLMLIETEQQLQGYMTYNADLFDEATIYRMSRHWQTILTQIVAHPDQPITHLSLLDADELQQVLLDWNATRTNFPQRCIHHLFEEQVVITPGAIAVVSDQEQLTYQELNQRANQVAHYLQTLGVAAETLVGLHTERSVEMIIGVLGILKAGGAYVPIDLTLPPLRYRSMAQQAHITLLLTQQAFASAQANLEDVLMVFIDGKDRPLIEQQPQENPRVPLTPDHLAYVIYTSGSTGQPKGVEIEHHSLHNYIQFLHHHLELVPGLHYATVSTLAADLGNTVIFASLTSGGCLHVPSYDLVTRGEHFAAYMQQHAIDILKIAPSHLTMLLENTGEPAHVLPRRVLLLGGEIFSLALYERLTALTHTCHILNHYGPTETTIGMLTFATERLQEQPNTIHSIPLGHPIANTRVYLLDQNLNPLPVGIPGELYIGGAGLARGYLHQPELTAERFIPDPFSTEPGKRLYKTGDRARYLPDGNLEFLGRLDHQIKLRGFRIELGEIESLLRQHPALSNTVAVIHEDANGDKQLIAYVIHKTGAAASASALRAFLKDRLPEYMLPSFFIPLEQLPLKPNGKIDLHALPAPENKRPLLTTQYLLPQTKEELCITAIWKEVLHREEIGLHDNFFDLGGHSLRMVQVQRQLQTQLQLDLSLLDLFKYPTVGSLAQWISQRHHPENLREPSPARTSQLLQEGKQRIKQRLNQKQHKNTER